MRNRRLNLVVLAVLGAALLTGCNQNQRIDGGVSLPPHSHVAPQSDNVVAHDPAGYCGNTVTTVRCEQPGKQEESWERSFWGGASVGLTDFLRWLDYRGELCRCLPEYRVKTEFSESEYGISLTGGYVRYGDKQCQLTEEQIVWLTEMLEEIKAGAGKDLCALPPAEKPVYAE